MTHARTCKLAQVLLCVVCGLGIPLLLSATPLDDARAQYDAGRFSQAYEALLIELDSVRPDPAAVVLALESLLAQGRILKAGEVAAQRVRSIHGDGADSIRANSAAFYYAGRVAMLTGDDSRATSRYRVYVAHSKGKSDARRNALLYLLEREPTLALYRAYVSLTGRTPDTRLIGTQVAKEKLRRSFKEFADITRYLLQLYPTAFDARRIIPRFQAALDARELGEAEQETLNKLMRAVANRESDHRRDWREIHEGMSRWVANDIRFEILCRIQESGDRLPIKSLAPHAKAAAGLEPDRIPAAATRLRSYEPIYAGTGSDEVYGVFLDAALSVPTAFQLSSDQIRSFLTTYRDLGADAEELDQRLAVALKNQGGDVAARRTILDPFRSAAAEASISASLAGLDDDKRAETVAWILEGRPANRRLPLDIVLLKIESAAGATEQLAATTARIASTEAGLLAHLPVLHANWLGVPLLGVEDRAAGLRGAHETRSVSPALSVVLASIAFGKPGAAAWESGLAELKGAAGFGALLEAYKTAVAARPEGDLFRLHWDFLVKHPEQRADAKTVPQVISVDARNFLEAYKGVVPGSAAQATNSVLISAWEICEYHRRQVAHDPAAVGEWGRTWVSRLAYGPQYQLAAEAAVASGMDLAESYAAALDNGAALNPKLFWHLAGISQLEMGMNYFIPIPAAALRDRSVYRKLIPTRPQWRMKGGPEFFTDLMWEYARSGDKHPDEYDTIKTMAKCHWQYFRAGNRPRQDLVLKTILADTEREPISSRINHLNLLIDNSRDATDDVTLQKLPDLYNQLNRFTRPRASIFTFVRENLAYWQKDPESPADKRAAAAKLDDAVVSQIILGLGSQIEVEIKQDRVVPAREWLVRHIAQMDWDSVSERIVPYAKLAIFDDLPSAPAEANQHIPNRFNAHVVPVLDALAANGGDELSYVLLGTLGKRGAKYAWLSKTVNDRMARVASGLDIIPVHENDPMYPLHKAARAMKQGNTGQAWLLTREHVDRLLASWKDLNRAYVTWALEQLRKRQFYEQGINLASDILLEEGIEPTDRAAVSLIRGDLFRDLRNYDAARIEYQALRDNKEYAGTSAAMQARYRLIEMMIDSRAYDNAEPLLERLLDSPDTDAQAEAWFLKARIAFLQEDYDGSKESIDRALSLSPTHAEALLLDGELRLHRERGLEEIEIRLGEKQLRTVLVPGRPLRLTLADRSLVVARHGKQVPVLVTTEPGGDRERLILFPAPGNRTSFSGVLSTMMGEAKGDSGRIEILGDDRIRYEIAPDFRAQFELDYGPKMLDVKSDAKLVASAGVILSEAELERLRMERRLGSSMNRGDDMDPSYGTIVRPGNPIYVQVTDKDRNVSMDTDHVQVNIETSSGDKLRVKLVETESLSTVFRGEVTSGIPFARASVSDSVEGNDPNAVISSVREGSWESEPDGVAPKWIQVDTMTSYEVDSATVSLPEPKRVTRLSVGASLSGAPMTIAEFPDPKLSDQVWLQAAPVAADIDVSAVRASVGDVPPMFGRESFERRAGTILKKVANPGVQPADVLFKDNEGAVAIRLSGVFYLNEAAERSMRCEGISTNAWARLLIDNEIVFERRRGMSTGMAGLLPAALAAGPHFMDLLLVISEPLKEPVIAGWQGERFEALPAAWFSVAETPVLADALSPNATITRTDTGFALSLREPRRYRKLEWVFEEFTGLQLTVDATEIRDSTNGIVIPVAQDFTMGLRNEVLEIASGDRITLSYHDEKRLSDENPILTTTLDAAYANGSIALMMEVVRDLGDGEKDLRYYRVQRCRRGDTLQVVVSDVDEDQSAEADTIKVLARTVSGEQVVLTAIEDAPGETAEADDGIHTGRFRAVLGLGDATEGHTIKLNSGELLKVSYLDGENLDPGVPVRRVTEVVEAGSSTPALFIIPQNITMQIDAGPEAAASLARLLRKTYNRGRTNLQIWATQTMDWYGEIAEQPEELWLPKLIMRERYLTSLDARLQIRVVHPAAALHEESQFRHVKIVTQSELADATADGREPRERKLSLRLMDMENGIFGTSLGFEVGREAEPDAQVAEGEGEDSGMMMEESTAEDASRRDAETQRRRREEAEDTTADGSPEVESSRYRVLVSADDVVQLRIDNEDGDPLVEKSVHVASDAFVELLERSFTARDRYVHLGEAFHVRVRDTDQDRTPERDTVRVEARSASGRSVEVDLNETFARSGVFEGKLITAPVSESTDTKDSDAEASMETRASLMVLPGEEVSIQYQDTGNVSIEGPRTVKEYGAIRHGADGGIAAFSKRFQDAEMAVKTSFLMAEALFEMAKDQSKLKNPDKAAALIARGREVLEEALRDFPDTSLVVRGEYLLANLAEELGQYDEAIRRYSDVSSSWPDSEYAPRALFKKALCLEKKGEPEQALEEYVRLTYLYKRHDLSSDAVVRLASYYYKRKHYETSAEIFTKFQQNNPQHRLAAKALTLAGLSHMKGEAFDRAMEVFEAVVRAYPDEKPVRSEAMYWLGDSAIQAQAYADAYRAFKQLTWDYPETKWAKMARGRLTENVLLNAGDRE